MEQLILLSDRARREELRAAIEGSGGTVIQRYGDRVWIVELPRTEAMGLAGRTGVVGVFDGPVPDLSSDPERIRDVPLDDAARLGIAAWNARHGRTFRRAKRARPGEGRAWDDPGFERER